MSSVFISNVDDYLSPSQACVNPMFADNTVEKKDEKKEDSDKMENAVVVPRKRRAVRKKRALETPNADALPAPSTPAKVSMADCLACSGCVTTAETVLVELHSLATLRQAIDEQQQRPVVMTISPASWADIVRKLQLPPSLSLKRRMASFLHETCRASALLDGRLPLQWSLQEAAREFCHAFRQRQSQASSIPPPSIAISSTSLVYADGMIVERHEREESRVPMITSSCPAVVCLVEKSCSAAVPHLSTTKSPMAMAGAYFRYRSTPCYHVAIMPCHDKKLEASRKDLQQQDAPDVDLVITTQELWTLLCDTLGTDNVQEIGAHIQGLPMAAVSTNVNGVVESTGATLVVPPSDVIERDDELMMDVESDGFFPYGSGGYADYVFRFACQELFGYTMDESELPWTLVETQQARRIASARVAASAKRRRDFFQVVLYRHVDGSYSCSCQSDGDVPVLRFATAYGSQTIQRVLHERPFSQTSSTELPFDYVEAMACPSGCPNGGGQIREANQRETPTETRQRVNDTQEIMRATSELDGSTNPDYPTDFCPTGPFGTEAKRLLHTRFHVVPPLQLTTGAVAGVALQDTQW